MGHHQLDTLDEQILKLIADNARIPFLEVARACNVSGAAIHQRIQKLTNLGILKGSEYVIDPEKIALSYFRNEENYTRWQRFRQGCFYCGTALVALTPSTVLTGIAASFKDKGFPALRAKNIFRPYFFGDGFFHFFGGNLRGSFACQFLLYFVIHIKERITNRRSQQLQGHPLSEFRYLWIR